MGEWKFGFWFWVRYFITYPILLILAVPYWIIKPFSKEAALAYYENNVFTEKIHDWIWG